MIRRYWYWLVLAAIITIAASLRFYRLTEIPYSLWVDEAWFEYRAQQVRQGIDPWPTVDPVFATGNSPFQLYATAFVQWLGVEVPNSARWVSATMGLLSVTLTFPFIRYGMKWEGFSEPLPIIAALAGTAAHALLYSNIHLSRDGNQNTACVVMTMLTLAGLYGTARTRYWPWAIFTGIALALALTTYEAAYMLPVIAVALFCIRIVSEPNQTKRLLALLAVVGVTAMVIFAPLLIYYGFHPDVALVRFRNIPNATPPPLGERILEGVVGFGKVWWGVFIANGDPQVGQNWAGKPFLDALTASLAGLGLIISIRQKRSSIATQLLLLTFVLFAVPVAITPFPPAFTRLLPVSPALLYWVGLGVSELWCWISARYPGLRVTVAISLVIGFITVGVFNSVIYFQWWANNPNVYDARQIGARRLGETILKVPATADVYVTPSATPLIYYTVRVLLEHQPNVTLFDATPDCFPYAHQNARPIHYAVITAFDKTSLPLLKETYPDGKEWGWEIHPQGFAYGLLYEVPAGLAAPSPQYPTWIEFQNNLWLRGFDAPSEVRRGDKVSISLYWTVTAEQTLKSNLTGFVHLSQRLPSSNLFAQHDGILCPGLPPNLWKTGMQYVETRALSIDQNTPEGLAELWAGVYDPDLQVRLGVLNSDVVALDNRVRLLTINIRE